MVPPLLMDHQPSSSPRQEEDEEEAVLAAAGGCSSSKGDTTTTTTVLLRPAQILSHDQHYGPFICDCCRRLVHPTISRVCQTCWRVQCRASPQCYSCGTERPIALDGLAVRVLNTVQVACFECDWNGNYGDYWDHMTKRHRPLCRSGGIVGQNGSCVAGAVEERVASPAIASSSSSSPPPSSPPPPRPPPAVTTISPKDESRKSPNGAEKEEEEEDDELWNELENLDVRSTAASLSEDGDVDEDEEDDDAKFCNDWNASINSNMGLWRDDDDEDDNSDDEDDDVKKKEKENGGEHNKNDKNKSVLERSEAKLAGKSKPTQKEARDNDDGIGPSDDASRPNKRSSNKESSSRKKESSSPPTERKRRDNNNSSGDLNRGGGGGGNRTSRRDGGSSSNNNNNNKGKPSPPPPESAREKMIRKAERYKKQANAKFNKGEYHAARSLYSKGIRTVQEGKHLTGGSEADAENAELLANMLSNRAVSYFHEKQFDRTIEDCNAAIALQPAVDKPYLRKWRAMMAQGDFDEAYRFIRMVSTQTFPESTKLRQEYKQCHVEREALETVKAFMNKGDIANAQSTLDHALANSHCDNIVLFVYSARLRITVGDFKPALEKINKTLRFNPDYVDALECRGYLYFFSGDLQKAASFLYDAYTRHKDCGNLKSALDRVQNTHQLVQAAEDAATAVKARPAESIELYTRAIHASQPMPPLALLNAQLQTARAAQRMKQQHYVDALKECQAIMQVRPRYGPAWVVRSKVMCALGKPEHAYRDLQHQIASWAKDDADVQRALKEVEFELRVLREEQAVAAFGAELADGDYRRLLRYPSLVVNNSPPSGGGSSSKNLSSQRSNPTLRQSNSDPKLMPSHGGGTTTATAGSGSKTRDSLKPSSSFDERNKNNNNNNNRRVSSSSLSSSTRDLKKSVSSRHVFANSISGFDLRNLTDINESLGSNDPEARQQQQQQRRMRHSSRESSKPQRGLPQSAESFRERPQPRDNTDRTADRGNNNNNNNNSSSGQFDQRRRYRKSTSQSQLMKGG